MTTTSPVRRASAPSAGVLAVSSDSALAVRPLRIGLIGFGTVGRGFSTSSSGEEQQAARDSPSTAVAAVLVREPVRDRGTAADRTLHRRSRRVPRARLRRRGRGVGRRRRRRAVVRELLARGTPVVTANKALVAERGAALARVAARSGATSGSRRASRRESRSSRSSSARFRAPGSTASPRSSTAPRTSS